MSDSKVKAGRDRSGKDVYRVGSELPTEVRTEEELAAKVAEQKRRQAQKPVGGGLAAAAERNKARLNPVSAALKKTSKQ